MGTEDSGRSQRMRDDGGGMQIALRSFSSLMTPAKSWKWLELEEAYYSLVQQTASFYTATGYDAGWSVALSVVEAGSVDANDVAPLWPTVPRSYFGASGWVDLDENGDRKPGIFDIWDFTDDGGFTNWGQYNGIEIRITWDDAKLSAAGIVRPGPNQTSTYLFFIYYKDQNVTWSLIN